MFREKNVRFNIKERLFEKWEDMRALEKDDNVISLNAELTIIREEIKRLERLKEQLTQLSEKTPYTEVGKKRSVLCRLRGIDQELEELLRQERLLDKSLHVILEAIPKLKNIQKKVFYMQRYTGKTLMQIAEELEYDYGYIRHIAAKANQTMKQSTK